MPAFSKAFRRIMPKKPLKPLETNMFEHFETGDQSMIMECLPVELFLFVNLLI